MRIAVEVLEFESLPCLQKAPLIYSNYYYYFLCFSILNKYDQAQSGASTIVFRLSQVNKLLHSTFLSGFTNKKQGEGEDKYQQIPKTDGETDSINRIF